MNYQTKVNNFYSENSNDNPSVQKTIKLPKVRQIVDLIDACVHIVKEDRILLRNLIKEFYQIDLSDYATNFQMSRYTSQSSSKFDKNLSTKQEIINIFIEAESRKCLNRFQYSQKDMKWLQISLRKVIKAFKKQKYQEQVKKFKGWQQNKNMQRLSRVKNKQMQLQIHTQKTSYNNSRMKNNSLQKINLPKNQFFSPKNIKSHSHRLSVNKFLQDYKHKHNYSNLNSSLQAKRQQNSFVDLTNNNNNQSGRLNSINNQRKNNSLEKEYKLITQKRYLLHNKNGIQSKRLSNQKKQKNSVSRTNLNVSRQKNKIINIKNHKKEPFTKKKEEAKKQYFPSSKHQSSQIQEVIHQSSYKNNKPNTYYQNSYNNTLNSTANFSFQKNSSEPLKLMKNQEKKFNDFNNHNRQNMYKKQTKISIIPQKDLTWYHASKKSNIKKSEVSHHAQLDQKLKKYQQTSKYLEKILQGNQIHQIQEVQQKNNKKNHLSFQTFRYGDIPLTSSVNVSQKKQRQKDSQILQKISYNKNINEQIFNPSLLNINLGNEQNNLFTKPQLLMECRKFINESQMIKSHNSNSQVYIDQRLSKNRSNIWISQDLQSQKNILNSKQVQNSFNNNSQIQKIPYYLSQSQNNQKYNSKNIPKSPKKLHIVSLKYHKTPQNHQIKIETAKQFLQKYFQSNYYLEISENLVKQMFSNLCQSLKPVIQDLLQQNTNSNSNFNKHKNILNFEQACTFFIKNGLLGQLKQSFSENIWKILNHTNSLQIRIQNILIFLQAIEQAGLSQIYSRTKYLLEKILQKGDRLNKNPTSLIQSLNQENDNGNQFMTKYNLYYLQLNKTSQISQLKRLLDPYDFSYQ